MSEQVYQQVEDAIRRDLCCPVGRSWTGSPWWFRPVQIEMGNIVMECLNDNGATTWTTDRWREVVDEAGSNLYRKVGMWEFAKANDPAADLIRVANSNPTWAGRRLHELEAENARLRAALEKIDGMGDNSPDCAEIACQALNQ